MDNFFKKIRRNKRGFTLTEVMIGMMILTIAIVSASNLLVSLVRSNRINTETLQAYYLAQEGIEAVRNIRDTNWLHNVHLSEEAGKVYESMEKERAYSVNLVTGIPGGADQPIDSANIGIYAPWEFANMGALEQAESDWSNLVYKVDGFEKFYRRIEILEKPECEGVSAHEYEDLNCASFFKIRSIVSWGKESAPREVILETVLSDWKGGAF